MSTASSSTSSSSDTSGILLPPATPPPAPTGWKSWLWQKGSGLVSSATTKASNLWQGTKERIHTLDTKMKDKAYNFGMGLGSAIHTGSYLVRHPIKKLTYGMAPEHLTALKATLDEILAYPQSVSSSSLYNLHAALAAIPDEQWEIHFPGISSDTESLDLIHNLQERYAPQHAFPSALALSEEEILPLKTLYTALARVITFHEGFLTQWSHGKVLAKEQHIVLKDVLSCSLSLQNEFEESSFSRESLLPLTQSLEKLLTQFCYRFQRSALRARFEASLEELRAYHADPTRSAATLRVLVKATVDTLRVECYKNTDDFSRAVSGVANFSKLVVQDTLPEVFGKPSSPFTPTPFPVKTAKPSVITPASSPSKTKPGMLGALFSYGLQQISAAIKSGVESVGDQGAHYIGIWLLPALQEGAKALENKSEFKKQRNKLREIIAAISEEKTPGVKTLKNDLSLQQLWQILRDNIDSINSVNINIHGFDLPKIASSAETPDPKRLLIQNSHKAREAKNLHINPDTTEKRSWKQRAQSEKKLWVRNTTNFVVIKRIFEKGCKFNPNNALYYQLMQEANQASDPKAKLKELFFEELNNRGINGFKRAYLKVYYTVFWSFLNHILKDLTTNISQEVFNWIENNKQNEYAGFKSMIIENFTRYLGILSGSYQRVATDPKPYNTPQKMLIKDLADPELNDGYTTEQLYTNFAQGLFNKYVKSWFNSALLKLAVGDGKELVQELISSGIKSLSDDYGYTHTLNLLLVEQLEQLIHTIRYEIASGKKLNPTATNPALSEQKKSELQSLVKNLLEVLPMGKCNTHAELRTLLKGDSLRANLSKFKDSLFLDKVIENVTDGISDAMHMILKKERLHEIMYKMTSSLNRIYVEGDSSTVEQREATQDRLSKLSSELLDLHIHASLDRYLSPPESNTTTPTKGYVKQLKKSTSLFVSQVQKRLKQLNYTSSKLGTEEAISVVNALLKKADAYQENCINELQEIEQSELSKNNKNALKKRYEEAAKKAKPLIEALIDLKHSPHRLLHNKALKAQLKPVDQTLKQIQKSLTSLDNVEEWMKQLKESIAEITRLNINDSSIENLVEKTPLLRKTIKALKGHQSVLAFCSSQKKLIAACEKAGKLNNPDLWIDAISSLNNQNLEEKLSQNVKQIVRAPNDQAFKKALREYKQEIETADEETTVDLKKTKRKARKLTKEIRSIIKTNHLLDSSGIRDTHKQRIADGLKTAKARAKKLGNWSDSELTDVLQYDVSSTIVKKAAKFVSGYVFNEIKDKFDSLLQFIRKEETYLFGLARHQVMLPYLRATKPQKS